MAKKKVQKPAVQPAMTKKQLSRWEKQKKQERWALAFVVAVVALVVVVLGFGFYRENLEKPNATFAKINGVSLPVNSWVTSMVLQNRNLDRQTTQWRQQLALMAGDDEVQAYYRALIQQQIDQIAQTQQELIYTVPEDLMSAELIRQEAEKRGLTVSPAEIEAKLVEYFSPTPQEPVTDTESTTPTPTPIPADAWKTSFKEFLTSMKASEKDFNDVFLLPTIRQEKLQAALSETVPVSGEQVRVSHIVTETSEAASAILARLQAGEDFAAVAKEMSADTASAEIGGDLGWYPIGLLGDEFSEPFESAAWALEKGAVVTAPIASSYGYHIVKQTDRVADRPYDADKRSLLQQTVLNKWLSAQMASPVVERFMDSDKLLYVQTQVNKLLTAK